MDKMFKEGGRKMSTMDWEKESKGEYTVYPDATYKVKLKDWENINAKTGTPQIRWHAQIVEPLELEGKSILEHTPLSEKALWRLAKFVSACGIDISKLPKMEIGSASFNRTLDACRDRVVYWKVYKDTYGGKEKNKIDDYLVDSNQPMIEVDVEEGLPDFLKETEE